MRGYRRVGWPVATADRPGSYRHGGRSDGSMLGDLGRFSRGIVQGNGGPGFGIRERGLRPHPELVLNNPRARKMPYAPAIAIGTLISFFSR